jgi:hypothetical protein
MSFSEKRDSHNLNLQILHSVSRFLFLFNNQFSLLSWRDGDILRYKFIFLFFFSNGTFSGNDLWLYCIVKCQLAWDGSPCLSFVTSANQSLHLRANAIAQIYNARLTLLLVAVPHSYIYIYIYIYDLLATSFFFNLVWSEGM